VSVWRLSSLLFVAATLGAFAAPVSFKGEIAPLLNRRCAACHNEETPKGRYRLDTFASLRKPGESDAAPLVAGKASESELYRLLVEADPHDRMPQKADALPKEEITLIKRWIDEGAVFDGGAADRPLVQMARETFLRAAPQKYARPAPVTALVYSPDARRLLAAGYYEATLWNAETGELVRRIGGLPERITALAWHPKRNLIAVAGGTPAQWGTVALVDPTKNYAVRILCDLPETALCVAFSPDGKTLVAGAGDRTTRFFDTATGKQTRVLRQHADWVQSIAFSPDGARLVSASRDRTVRVFTADTGEIDSTYFGHETAVLSAVFNSKGTGVFSLGVKGKAIHEWEARAKPGKARLIELPGETPLWASLSFAWAYVGADHAVRVEQLSDRKLLFTLTGHRDTVQSIAVPPYGSPTTFATGSADGEVRVWSLGCGTDVVRFLAIP
jgi:hypothetical protein